MNENKLCGMLGLARRAGCITIGASLVCDEVRGRTSSKPALVIIASDASENSCKRVVNCCTYYNVGYVKANITTDTLAHAIGKRSAVSAIAIKDGGFAGAIREMIEQKQL